MAKVLNATEVAQPEITESPVAQQSTLGQRVKASNAASKAYSEAHAVEGYGKSAGTVYSYMKLAGAAKIGGLNKTGTSIILRDKAGVHAGTLALSEPLQDVVKELGLDANTPAARAQLRVFLITLQVMELVNDEAGNPRETSLFLIINSVGQDDEDIEDVMALALEAQSKQAARARESIIGFPVEP